MTPNEKQSKHESNKKYRDKKRLEGWVSYLVFGPPDFIGQMKSFAKKLRVKMNVYEND